MNSDMEESNKILITNKLKDEAKEPYEKSITQGLISLAETDTDLEKALMGNRKLVDCFAYVKNMAKKQAKNGCACVRNDIVFAWAADFYKMPDEEYKKFMEKPKVEKKPAEKKVVTIKKDVQEKPKAPDRNPVPKAEKKKQDNSQLDGQLDIFSYLG